MLMQPSASAKRWPRRLMQGSLILWLCVFVMVPLLVLLKISFAQPQLAQPPYTDLWQWQGNIRDSLQVHSDNYHLVLTDNLYLQGLLNSLRIAAIATLGCLIVGFPMAYAISRVTSRWRMILLMLIILPFWTSFLLRVYAWIDILKDHGFLNQMLLWIGIIDQPIPMLYHDTAIYIGIVYSYLPFMILPLYASLQRFDMRLLEAATDLGCPHWRAIWHIVLPAIRPGLIAGCLLVFIPAVGEFVIPDLLGASDTVMLGKLIWNEFFTNRDWPVASTVVIVMLLVLLIPMWFVTQRQDKTHSVELS